MTTATTNLATSPATATAPSAFAKAFHRDDPLLTDPEAEDYLGLKRGVLAVWRSTKRHQITHLRIGRLVRYKKSDLDDFLIRCTISAETGTQ